MSVALTAPAFSLAPKMTPGVYMKACRKQAGLSKPECARQLAIAAHDRAKAEADLSDLEADRPGDYGRLVQHLKSRAVFRFDLATFSFLAAGTSAAELDEWADI